MTALSPKGFFLGLSAHGAGIRFALQNKRYLAMALIPFCLTILIYTASLWSFARFDESLLNYFWTVDSSTSSGFIAVLYWLYTHVVKLLLYFLLFILFYFLFIIITNILASPFYDHIAESINTLNKSNEGLLKTVLEELKKASFVIVIPLIFLFIPVIGGIISFILAAVLLAWDFIDFSLSKELPVFKDRFRFIRTHFFLMFGFGILLLVPIINIILYPFAIISASLLYGSLKNSKA